MSTSSCHPSGSGRPALDIADIFRAHGEAFRQKHALTLDQARVMRAIETCRTAALGGHVDVCDHCGFERPAYNSCRNRHCPKCQSLAQARWVEQQMERILPTHYFHTVFTLPDELREPTRQKRRCVFSLMFQSAAGALLDLGHDERRLGALLGFTAVLHTWTRDLRFHPHLHTIVTGGGLHTDTGEWVTRHGGRYPTAVLGTLFRGKFVAALTRARDRGELRFTGRCAPLNQSDVFEAFKDRLYSKDWVVYAKPPFGGAEEVYRYLGRYTHRVGISNFRLQAIDDNGVRFSTKDGNSVTLTHEEFIRRFLLHVLPTSFVKIRHYGLFAAPNLGTHLVRAREALQASPIEADQPRAVGDQEPDRTTEILLLTGLDLIRCPRCTIGIMTAGPGIAQPSLPPRAPPA